MPMKVILSQDVETLGEEGAVVQVANGYARNFLLPRKLAVPYSAHNEHLLEQRKRTLTKKREDKRVEAMGVKERIEALELTIAAPAGDSGKLFGSVNAATIAEELAKHGLAIDRRKIVVAEHHLRETGEHVVKVRLYGDEEASLKIVVEKA
jgi:large subunit ribosomal protein L9